MREVVQIVENNEEVSVKCEFCGKIRTLEKVKIQEALEKRLKETVKQIRDYELPVAPRPDGSSATPPPSED